MKKCLVFIISFHLFICAFSQTDSCYLRISLLTCSPGEEIYTVWGHSALRVTDRNQGIDLIFNYGTFDFDDSKFIIKFARGSLLYFVSVDEFNNFVSEYRYFKRGIIEQELMLSCAEKKHLALALELNAREENKYYKYHFLYDNCSTRLRDMVAKNTYRPLIFKKIIPDNRITFRQLIHEYLERGQKRWVELGIDILLGRTIDVQVKNEQAMLLPDYLMKGLDSATTAGEKLVLHKQTILAFPDVQTKPWTPPPTIYLSILFLLIALLGLVPKVASSFYFRIFDLLLFFITGLLGILLVVMWLGREDSVCSENFNLIWALPTHAVMAWMLPRQKKWIKTYWQVNAILLLLLLLSWKWLPQEMNNALLPLVALLLLRSFILFKRIKT